MFRILNLYRFMSLICFYPLGSFFLTAANGQAGAVSLSVGASLSGAGNMISVSGGAGATTGGNVLVSSGKSLAHNLFHHYLIHRLA